MVNLFLFEAESQKFTVLDRSFTTTYLFLNLLWIKVFEKKKLCVKTNNQSDFMIPSFLMGMTLDKN